MKITIRPDPDCIELIRSEFKDMIIGFLKSLSVSDKDAENWEAKHTIDINEYDGYVPTVFGMKCYLNDDLFTKPEWVFKFAEEEFFTSFIISGIAVCCRLSTIHGLKHLPQNLFNLSCFGYSGETLNDCLQDLKKLPCLIGIGFNNCTNLKEISFLQNFINLRSLNFRNCNSLTDISSLSGLINLVLLDFSNCESLTNISSLSGLINLQWLDLNSCTEISSISGLLNLKTLNHRWCESLNDISSLAGLHNLQTLSLIDCKSLTDISSLSGLVNLQALYLSSCESLTDISSLAGLHNLQHLSLHSCKSLTDITILSGLVNLQSLELSWSESLTDISSISGLLNLKTLILSGCKSLTDTSSLSGLVNLQSLELKSCSSLSITDIGSFAGLLNLQIFNLGGCESLTDISSLAGLLNLQTLSLIDCKSLTDISSLSGLVNLQSLNLSNCKSLTNISSLSGLLNLQTLKLSNCKSLTNISSLSGLINLQFLSLSYCHSLTDISSLSGFLDLQWLELEGCKRIQSYFCLKNCLALNVLEESNMHPTEHAELLCFLAVQRKDKHFILSKIDSWLEELKFGFSQNNPSANDLACSLAQGVILIGGGGLILHQILHNHPNVELATWKIWFSQVLKAGGWDDFNKGARLNKPSELTFGAIGGISFCLPSMEGDPAQTTWAKKWISEIHSLHNTNPSFLKPAAAEWCLALKRLSEDELLREWIEKFTDPSDPSALDPINKVFSVYALDLNDSESALEYALKINDPKFRDESILNLAKKFIKEGETSKAGEFMFLLTQVESRTQLAYSLAEDVAYLKSDENAHRLLAACGDNPQSLASILDKLRLAHPASEILKIMHEKLSDESRSEIPIEKVVKECNGLAEFLIHTKDSSQLVRIQQAIESVMKSN